MIYRRHRDSGSQNIFKCGIKETQNVSICLNLKYVKSQLKKLRLQPHENLKELQKLSNVNQSETKPRAECRYQKLGLTLLVSCLCNWTEQYWNHTLVFTFNNMYGSIFIRACWSWKINIRALSDFLPGWTIPNSSYVQDKILVFNSSFKREKQHA